MCRSVCRAVAVCTHAVIDNSWLLQTSGSSMAMNVAVSDVNHLPHLTASGCKTSVHISNMDFHGGLSGDILNLFKSYVEKDVDSLLESTLCSKAQGVVDSDLNSLLSSFSLSIPLDLPGPLNISNAEFGLVSSPVVASEYVACVPCVFVASLPSFFWGAILIVCGSYVTVALQGAVVNRAKPVMPPFKAAALPTFTADDADHMVQLFISPFVFNSGAWVFFEVRAQL